jgi:hypothetical protein
VFCALVLGLWDDGCGVGGGFGGVLVVDVEMCLCLRVVVAREGGFA